MISINCFKILHPKNHFNQKSTLNHIYNASTLKRRMKRNGLEPQESRKECL
ncbi:unnamed protein product [Penicillium roqueforti FM164]|uniref:Genomic scaffold, ProqFM164S02 n=1 Tax=Penicillium roqueforti (strain FM164) TaxID=1365484 RepID=W6QAL2_PENRF|nr:unnamed protein product [Penicillium roqueforti FM164]